MQNIDYRELIQSEVEFRGALGFDWRDEGVSPRRLPDWTRLQVPELMNVMVRMPSGVRLAFRTDSRCVQLSVLTTRLVESSAEPRDVVFDLCVNGGDPVSHVCSGGNTLVYDRLRPGVFDLRRGDKETVRFEDLPAGDKFCELFLPANAYVEIRRLSLDDGASLASPPVGQRRWAHYGSSISHCMEADRPTGVWPVVASRIAGFDLTSLGFGGQCHLDQFVARTLAELPVDFISIKAGINIANMDSMRERVFTPALHGFLDTLRESKPATPILLVSPIYCPSAEDHPGPTIPDKDGRFVTIPGADEIRQGCLTLKRMRHIMQDLVERRRKAGDEYLAYLSGLELFSEADAGDLPDDLHPNPPGYRRMGERFAQRVFGEAGLLSELSR